MKRLALIIMLAALSACTAFHGPNAYLPSRDGIQVGETVTVKGNENIYTIAREHDVSMRELIVLNNLKPPFEVHPGQDLILPAGGTSFAGDMKPPEAAPLDEVEKSPLAPIEPSAVSSQPLAPVVAPVIAQAPATAPPQALVPQPLPNAALATQVVPASKPVEALNSPTPPPKPVATTVAAVAAPAAPAAVAPAVEALNMVWPVQGPILSAFGSKGAGLNNDGVNIGAPKGAPVVAAAPGMVVYAGDEMKGFGNLVLIRHQGDWVTAYAHLDRVLVKKDTIVGQGDMIGTVGKTGDVTTPQLHFETRQSGKPVDPATVVKHSM
ncbi:MAG: M23 family metallopeptidase [Alphaproteobacteria bacterium]